MMTVNHELHLLYYANTVHVLIAELPLENHNLLNYYQCSVPPKRNP
jgi:hypothetical protein